MFTTMTILKKKKDPETILIPLIAVKYYGAHFSLPLFPVYHSVPQY